jgi:gliding motility-associated-like protein
MLCDTSMQLNAENLSTSSVVKTYDWQVFNRSMQPLGSFNSPRLQYQFSDTGLYYVKLVINRVDICSDSMTSPVYVYPGFKPDFTFAGVCTNKPTAFTDQSVTRYGVVNGWSWDFGEPLIPDDVSNLQNPSFTYDEPGNKSVRLIVKNSVGCIDTTLQILPLSSRPPLQLAFTDTLICLGDTLQLSAASAGTIQWSPASFISNTVGPSTKVLPKSTTTYFADLNDNGCLNRDSVIVNVVNGVLLQAMNDTLICATDALTLRLQSNALQYHWTPTQVLPNAQAKQPVVRVNNTTTFYVEGVIGGCRAVDSIKVQTVPYPTAYAGADTVVCFNSNGFLHATTNGSSVLWTPSNNLNNAASLDPISNAMQTTTFVLNAYDNKGCPKPGIDSLIVVVLPDIIAFAGRDTNVVVGQPLQLNASGGSRYVWQPATYLSSNVISNPIAIFTQPLENHLYKILVYDDAGCVDSAAINVKVFAKGTTVYVPTGFTPNNDGKNDVIRPVLAGVISLKNFSVYNRFGQLVFSTNKTGLGWNGKLNGVEQPSGNYVWMVEVLNYDNSVSQKKGTVMLIR